MDDKEQAAIDALLAAGLEAEAAAVRELRRRHKETMDAMHAAQRDSYKNGRNDERERCARAVVDYSLSYSFDENDRSLFAECAQYLRDGVLPRA